MDWLGVTGLAVYGCLLVSLAVAVWHLVTTNASPRAVVWRAWATSGAALFGGGLLTVVCAPDWSPPTLLGMFIPVWGFAAWSASYAWLRRQGAAPRLAAVRAGLFALPALLLAPAAAALAGMIGGPGAIAVLVILVVTRPGKRDAQSSHPDYFGTGQLDAAVTPVAPACPTTASSGRARDGINMSGDDPPLMP